MKNKLFWGVIGSLIGMATTVCAVETIRPEDEKLLDGILNDTKGVTETVAITDNQQETSPVIEQELDEEFDETTAPMIDEEEPIYESVSGLNEIQTPDMPSGHSRIEDYKNQIADCLDLQKEKMNLEIDMLYAGNVYDDVAYLSQTFTEINVCYQNVGSTIVEELYHDDDKVRETYENKTREFFVQGTDVNFGTEHCGDHCSVKALAEKQKEKFAEFRTYLAELIANRPRGL